MRAAERTEFDYFHLTHIHPEHLDGLGPANPPYPKGNYRLTGVMDVDTQMPIGKLITEVSLITTTRFRRRRAELSPTREIPRCARSRL